MFTAYVSVFLFFRGYPCWGLFQAKPKGNRGHLWGIPPRKLFLAFLTPSLAPSGKTVSGYPRSCPWKIGSWRAKGSVSQAYEDSLRHVLIQVNYIVRHICWPPGDANPIGVGFLCQPNFYPCARVFGQASDLGAPSFFEGTQLLVSKRNQKKPQFLGDTLKRHKPPTWKPVDAGFSKKSRGPASSQKSPMTWMTSRTCGGDDFLVATTGR